MAAANKSGPIDDRFDAISETEWSSFADSWLAELDDGGGLSSEYSNKVTYMKFFARPKHLWTFILLTTERAETDHQLGHIAAGLVERLLGRYGEDYIGVVEQRAHADPRFAKALTGAWKHLMTDDIWRRVQILQELSPGRLDTTDQHARVVELEQRLKEMLEEARRQRMGTS